MEFKITCYLLIKNNAYMMSIFLVSLMMFQGAFIKFVRNNEGLVFKLNVTICDEEREGDRIKCDVT